MAKNCLCCGKNIGLLTVCIPLLENEELVICSDCFEKMPSVLNDLYQKRIHPTKSELLTIKEEIIEQLNLGCYNKDVINVVTKYLDNKISKAKNPEVSEDWAILKKCLICQSENIQKISTMTKAGSVALWGIFSQKIKKQWHCNSCGSEW